MGGYGEINGRTVPEGNSVSQNWGAGRGTYQGRSGAGAVSAGCCTSIWGDKRSRLQTSGASSGGLRTETGGSAWVSEGDGNIARASSIHGPKMGGRSKKENDEMKTLVVANQKGGVGKTATLVHLAWYAAEHGAKVVVIDLDTQGNASYTLAAHDSKVGASSLLRGDELLNVALDGPGIKLIKADARLADTEKMNVAQAAEHFRQSLQNLAGQGFDLCLIDTAPSLGITMAVALMAGDFVLSPIELEAYSIQGIEKMLLAVNNIKKVNRRLSFLGMVPSKVDGRNPRHKRHLAELTAAYQKWIVPNHVGLRSSIADALASKRPVWTIKRTAARKAASEVQNLASDVFSKMGVVF